MSVLEIGLVLVNMYNIISSCRALDSDYIDCIKALCLCI